uniref:Kinetochore protein SPC25 n=1 Tax=Craspedostauros australis TaxID=1486917 RepID=A0A7R9WSN0_9STRA|mmetsp:Transcript_16692/g.46133  ORF Transcript_16692/g.46133 Transcript_16692/m.46133 type:complete len:250 (+) Transcript_16692:237-986(+)
MPPLATSKYDNPINTTGLLQTIRDSRTKLDGWIQRQKQQADEEAEQYHQVLNAEQSKIDHQVGNLLAVQFQRGLSMQQNTNEASIASRRANLQHQCDALRDEVEHVQCATEKHRDIANELEAEELKQRHRAEEARTLKSRLREAKQTTVDDLTRGLVNYKYLGFDFEKCEETNALRIAFTQLDPAFPNREFSFILLVNDADNQYYIHGCQPNLDATAVTKILKEINRSDDVALMIRQMRKEFVRTLQKI